MSLLSYLNKETLTIKYLLMGGSKNYIFYYKKLQSPIIALKVKKSPRCIVVAF